MGARIYQSAKPATQSGRFKTGLWVVEHELSSHQRLGLGYSVREPHARVVRPKAYADNFVGKT